ncbi:DNA polymerase [uncultured Veillonella sp.]|uniref:DNA polymerase n=1 Tax=uncultured Veillonella sp. TaxID=159268 RepID=UPI0025DEB82F|nr:DNA polymerase [uncultured Veillonella sp.]
MLVFDIETNGLLQDTTKIHCMVIKDTETEEVFKYRPDEVEAGVEKLLSGDTICGHNVIAFDVPVIEKLYGVHFDRNKVVDTLVLARLVYSNIQQYDSLLVRRKQLPSNLFGRFSLKAFGYRIGILKGTYAEDNEEAWAVFNEDMLEYNTQDVIVTEALYNKLVDQGFTEQASMIEHKAQWLCQKMEQNGFVFDVSKAEQLKVTLETEFEKVTSEIHKYAPRIPDEVFIPKRDNRRLGYKKGVPVQRYKEFNPNSRLQLKYILKEHYKYNFKDSMYEIEVDKNGKETSRKLTLNEETLKAISNDTEAGDEVRHIAGLYMLSFMLSKRLGQLSEGQNAWLKLVDTDGKIHGRINPNGAVSGRATHSSPNVAQVPAVDAEYGHECRELFRVPEGWLQAGVDCSGLELRCLAHYLYPYDNGEYAHEILNGDIHTANQKNAGLETRSQAKTFIYAFLYGGGNAKIGEIVGGSADHGKKLKEKFLKNTPAIKKLSNGIKNTLAPFCVATHKREWQRKYLVGLDGRKLYVRSLHSALNLLLQSAGALICKRWLTRTEERLESLGYTHGWNGDYSMMAWVHDEFQCACRTQEIAEAVVREAQEAVRDVQQEFNFRVQLDTEGKIGKNWAECH